MNAMQEPITCQRCLYTTSHALGLILDSQGICSGCRVHEEKDRLDWSERWRKLETLVAPFRVASGKAYDCIVPVTGANDSHFIVHLVKERLGLNPLLVTYNKYFNTPLGVRNLANLRIRFNCDIIFQNVNPLCVKNITRATLRRFGSIYWPCLAGHTVFPVQTAVRYKVPLIIWGAHQGLEQVGMFSHEHEVEMTRRYRKDHDLMGYEADDLLSIFDTLKEEDIWQYRYPDDADLHQVGVRGIYLGNYVRWDPKAQHEQMIATHGYKGARFERTFDTYDHVDCFNFMDLHDSLKLVKHGYSKVTDHVSREIRHGRLSRETGLALVSHYEKAPLQHVEKFCEWLGLDHRGLQFIIDQHRNTRFWNQTAPGKQWSRIRQDTCCGSYSASMDDDLGFHGICDLGYVGEKPYITIGKGYPV
jgi:N-acetyl sugar amidotransferase